MANITKASAKDNRSRTWAFVAYPESMPENWREILDALSVPWACSPLHDKDINETTGEVKKPHRHFVISFPGKKSYEQIKEITDKLNAPVPQKCLSIRGAVRYFLHLDNPEKAQYGDRKNEILSGGSFDIEDALKLSATEKDDIVEKLEAVIYEKHVSEYAHLAYWVKTYHREWREVLKANTLHLNSIIKSLRHTRSLIDIETGEVIFDDNVIEVQNDEPRAE